VDVNARLVDHGNIEWSPILEEGEIKELVIDRKVVIYGIVIWRIRGATSGTCADLWLMAWLRGELVEDIRLREWMREGSKIESGTG